MCINKKNINLTLCIDLLIYIKTEACKYLIKTVFTLKYFYIFLLVSSLQLICIHFCFGHNF